MTPRRPTTDQVREFYALGVVWGLSGQGLEGTNEEFDDWIQDIKDESYDRGYDDGYSNGYEAGANEW